LSVDDHPGTSPLDSCAESDGRRDPVAPVRPALEPASAGGLDRVLAGRLSRALRARHRVLRANAAVVRGRRVDARSRVDRKALPARKPRPPPHAARRADAPIAASGGSLAPPLARALLGAARSVLLPRR